VGGVGVLGNAAAAKPIEDILGHRDPGSVGIDSVGRVGQQLVDGVDAERESASVLVELERREHTVGRLFGCYGALIPVAEGLTEREPSGARRT